jgi:hypothetical protein
VEACGVEKVKRGLRDFVSVRLSCENADERSLVDESGAKRCCEEDEVGCTMMEKKREWTKTGDREVFIDSLSQVCGWQGV